MRILLDLPFGINLLVRQTFATREEADTYMAGLPSGFQVIEDYAVPESYVLIPFKEEEPMKPAELEARAEAEKLPLEIGAVVFSQSLNIRGKIVPSAVPVEGVTERIVCVEYVNPQYKKERAMLPVSDLTRVEVGLAIFNDSLL